MNSAIDFLSRYHFEEDFLDRIVVGDETWVAYVNPEARQQSMCWGRTTSPSMPKKVRQTLLAGKVMTTVFWDAKRTPLVDFMECGTTITFAAYCDTWKRLRRAIQNSVAAF